MVARKCKSRLQECGQEDLIRQFVAGATARIAADLVGANRHTATLYLHKLRELIASRLAEKEPWLSGEVAVDKSYFGVSSMEKHGRGAAGQVLVFGLRKRGGKIHVVIIQNTKHSTLIPIIRQTIEPDSIVYTDVFLSYDALDISEFQHQRINHSERFVEARNHINGIKNFWNQAKRHLRRFNYRPTARLFKSSWDRPKSRSYDLI